MRHNTKDRGRKYKFRRKTYKMKGGKLCSSNNSAYSVNDSKLLNKRLETVIYKNDNPNIIIKQIGPLKMQFKKHTAAEIEVAKIASELNVGPRVFHTTICDEGEFHVGYLVMEKIIGVTFVSLPKDKVEELTPERNRLLDILYDNGIVLEDIALRNVMYGHTATDPKDRVWLIDFGYHLRKEVRKEERKYNYNE